eukprot:g31867.t1
MAISVRVAEPSDAPAIDRVLGACYPVLFRGAYDEEALEAFLPHLIYSQPELLESGKFFVAESDACILACGGWSLHRPGSREVIAGLGHLRHFAVHPDCIGKGIGRSIFEACEKQSKEFGESVASSFHESAAPLEAALAEVAADGILEVLEVVNEAAPPAERDSLADAFMDAALALDAEEFQLDSPTSPLSLDANSRVSGRVVVVGEGKAGKTSEAMDEKLLASVLSIPASTQSGQMEEGSKQSLVIKSIIAYEVFGALQVFYRLWSGWRKSTRMRAILDEVPMPKGLRSHSPGGWVAEMIANLYRLHDWRHDICVGQPISKLVGFPWAPAPYFLLANDPAIVRHILKDEFNKYTKPDSTLDGIFYYFEEFLGSGIFVVKHGIASPDAGQEWTKMRKVSAQIFSRSFAFVCARVPNKYGRAFDLANVATRNHGILSTAPFLIFSVFLPWPFGGTNGGLARACWDLLSPEYRQLKRQTRVLDFEADRLVKKCLEDPRFAEPWPGKASAAEMPYLNGVLYEALRLWPPVPFDFKMAFADDVLPGNYKVPAYTNVAFIPFNMGRDATRYAEPLQFRPERWIPFKAPPQHEFPARAARSSGAGPPLHATGDAQTSGAPSTDPSLRPSSSNPPTTSETSQAPRGFRKYLPEAATASVPLLRPVKDESGLGTPRCKRSVSFAAFSSMGASVEEKLHDAREAASKGREIQLEIEANKEPFPIRAILAAKKVAQEAAEAVEEARQRIEQERVEKFVDEAAEQAQQAQHKAAQEATSRLADTMEGIAEDLEVLMPYKIQVDFPHAEQPQSSSSSPSSPCSSPVGTDGSDPQSDLWSNPRSDPRWSQIGAALEARAEEILQKELTSKEHQLAEEELNTKAVPEESLRLDSPSATWALRGNVSCALRAQARDGRRGVSRLLGARDSARGAADGGRAVNQSSCLGRSMAAVSPPGKRRLKAHLTSSYVFKEPPG